MKAFISIALAVLLLGTAQLGTAQLGTAAAAFGGPPRQASVAAVRVRGHVGFGTHFGSGRFGTHFGSGRFGTHFGFGRFGTRFGFGRFGFGRFGTPFGPFAFRPVPPYSVYQYGYPYGGWQGLYQPYGNPCLPGNPYCNPQQFAGPPVPPSGGGYQLGGPSYWYRYGPAWPGYSRFGFSYPLGNGSYLEYGR